MVRLKLKNNKIAMEYTDEESSLVYRSAKIFYRDFRGELRSENLIHNKSMPLGALETFKKRADRFKLNYEIVDERSQIIPDRKLIYWGEKEPRRHQSEILDAVKGESIGLISSPTGSGKTLIATLIAEQKTSSTLVIVPTELAQANMYEEMSKAFGKKNVSTSIPERPAHVGKAIDTTQYKINGISIIKSNEDCENRDDTEQNNQFSDWLNRRSSKTKIDKKSKEYRDLKIREARVNLIRRQNEKTWHKAIHIVCFASIKNLPRWYLSEIKCLIIDEAHTSYASMIKKLMLSLDSVGYCYGLSATPWRDQNHENFILKSLFGGKIIYDYSIEEAIADGVHAKVEVLLVNTSEPQKYLKKEKNPRIIMDDGIIRNSDRNEQICRIAYEQATEGHSVFIGIDEDGHFNGKPDDEDKTYCLRHKLSKYRGLDVYYISGDLSLKEKLIELSKIRENKNGYVVVGTMAFGIAVDVPDIDVAIHASWGKSTIRLIQRSGRAARTGGKDKRMRIYLMWDWWNNALKKQSKARIKSASEYYKTTPIRG